MLTNSAKLVQSSKNGNIIMTIMFILMMWGQGAYITIPNLPSEQACDDKAKALYQLIGPSEYHWRCTAYQQAEEHNAEF